MIAVTILMAALAAPPEELHVRYNRGMEIVYRGYSVDVTTGNLSAQRQTYDLLTRVFVIESDREFAVSNTATDKDASSTTQFGIVGPRLPADRFAIDPVILLELPSVPLEVGASWATSDDPRPPRGWKVEASESPPQGGGRCWKLRSQQQSNNWEMADGARAWRKEEVSWVDSRTFLVQRSERVLVIRDPNQPDRLRRVITCHQIEGSMIYPSQLDAEVRAEIAISQQTFEHLQKPSDSRMLDMLARRLANHVRNQPKTAWRESVLAAAKQADAVRCGEVVAVAAEEDAKPEWFVGRPAPDFIAYGSKNETLRLSDCRGKPVIIGVFQSIMTPAVGAMLHSLGDANSDKATVVIADQSGQCNAPPQNSDLAPVFDSSSSSGLLHCGRLVGRGFFGTTTPRFMLINNRGTVEQIIDGYGPEVPTILRRYLESADRAK